MTYSEALEQQVRLHRWCVQVAGQPGGFVEKIYGGAAWFHMGHEVLKMADPYYVSAEIGHVLNMSSNSMPDLFPTEGLLPTRKPGFVWFAQPLPLPNTILRNKGNVATYLRALQWAWVSAEPAGLFICPWIEHETLRPVPWSFFEWRSTETQAQAIVRELGDLEAGHVFHQAYARRAYDICAAFLLFVQQRILSVSQHQLERHARRRIQRDDWKNELVRVVELRRRERVGPVAQPESVEWSCQWIVRGHWRQQFYPRQHGNHLLWITPHVKGPQDKPLKPPRATVFAVVR
jgi:hypothetical protein